MEVDNTTLNSVIDESEQYYLTGAYGIGDVLDDAGYKQVFMIGSEAKFAGRASFFKGHGNYEIWDYNTAVTTGHISSDYWVWWGYEDAKLYEYAKEKL